MDKLDIIENIKAITKANGGKAPGVQLFQQKTGIKKSAWYPNFWLRWGDAIKEAGFTPNEKDLPYEESYLIEKYILLIKELGRFPIDGELKLKRKSDSHFPSPFAFQKLGKKQDRLAKIISFCQEHGSLDDVQSCCEQLLVEKSDLDFEPKAESSVGYVYLIQHGKRSEYKIGRTNNPIRREGEIRLELPEKVRPIHTIETDDPAGIEKYWHNRFSAKRKEGEWFALSSEDVRVFKKWKKIW
jgi:hypothetical protein